VEAVDASSRLRVAFNALVELTRHGALNNYDLQGTVREITTSTATVLDCDGVSFWLLDADHTRMRTLDEFVRSENAHDAGREINTADFAGWMEAFQADAALAISDLATHPLGARFAAVALPAQARSLVTAIVRQTGRLVGMLVSWSSQPREWPRDSLQFARAGAELIASALARADSWMTEATLTESEMQFRLLAENMRDLVCLHDWHGRCLWLSPSSLRVLGYKPRELLGEDFFELIHPEDADRIRTRLWAPMRRGEAVQPAAYRVRRKDGTYTWLETVAERVVQDGDVVRLQTASREVNERVSIEQALAQNEERYRTVVESTLDGIILADLKTLQIVDANPGFVALTGRALDELLSLSLFDLLADPRETIERSLQEMQADGRGALGEFECPQPSGESLTLELNARVISFRGRDVICAVARNVTARKRSERLERDRLLAMELVAKGQPLETTLRHLVTMVERQRPDLQCSFLLSKETRATIGDRGAIQTGDLSSFETTPDTFAAPIQGPKGELLGIFAAKRRNKDNPVENEDLSLFVMASKLAAIALDQRKLTDRLAHQAQHDALTGLPNRRLLEDRLKQALASAERHHALVALLFIDLDGFKRINDTLGHATGDLLLKEVSVRLSRLLRATDTVARMGGDEFTIVLSEVAEAHAAVRVAQKILEDLREPFELEGHELFMTGSVGISMYPADGNDSITLLRHADAAMYRAKSLGRNAVHCFTQELNEAAAERLQVETHLRRAIENQELHLYYQPEVSETGQLRGVEALLRWDHPKLGRVPPSRFIPVAEDSGLIVPIGAWVLKEACKHYVAWEAEGKAPACLAVNVSSVQFRQPDFVATITRVIEESAIDPRRVELELTESVLMEDFDRASEKLSRLRRLGLSIAVDDFGTGYSSLSYLHRLPIDTLKIDQSFVRDIDRKNGTRSLVEAIIALARGLQLGVVAEGVETLPQVLVLQKLGCDRMQGHYFGEAVGPTAIPNIQANLRKIEAVA
jgi:diguanylate cyclase (GGDEF)-like protein/PAS domain S-box-containing protein